MKYFPNNPKSLLKDNNTVLSHPVSGTEHDASRFLVRELKSIHGSVRVSKTAAQLC